MNKLSAVKLVGEIKKAQNQIKNVKSCPICSAHLKAIKEHQEKGHKDA